MKFPKAMGACADLVYNLRQKRLAAQKVVADIEEEEKALKEHIINNLPKSESTGAAGKIARVSVVTKQIPQVQDWEVFWSKFNKKTDTDLLQRRLNSKAVEDRWENGKKVAGVEVFTAVSLSITKI